MVHLTASDLKYKDTKLLISDYQTPRDHFIDFVVRHIKRLPKSEICMTNTLTRSCKTKFYCKRKFISYINKKTVFFSVILVRSEEGIFCSNVKHLFFN